MVRGCGVVGEYVGKSAAPPPRLLTVDPEDVARAALRAIEDDVEEVLVSPGPMRLLLAVDALLPSPGRWLVHRMGGANYMRLLAEGRAGEPPARAGQGSRGSDILVRRWR
jgi:hypothetical protein